MTARLLGYRVGTSKKNSKEYCQMHLAIPCTERDQQNGSVGERTQVEFVPDGYVHFLKPSDIGKNVELLYEFNGRYVNLVDISVQRDSK